MGDVRNVYGVYTEVEERCDGFRSRQGSANHDHKRRRLSCVHRMSSTTILSVPATSTAGRQAGNARYLLGAHETTVGILRGFQEVRIHNKHPGLQTASS